MKKYISLLVTLMVTLFATNSLAFTPPPAPEHGGYVSDQAGKLSESQIQQLNQKIERISKTTKNEFGILLLQDMGGDNIEDVANATFKAWGVGKRGLDNGVLVVVAIKERKSRIETGKGAGGDITDLQANDILKKNLNPHLKTGDFFGGFDATLDAISGLMESRANQQAAPAPASTSGDETLGAVGIAFLVIIGAIVGIFGFAMFVGWVIGASRNRKQEEENERIFEEEQKLAAKRRAERSRQLKIQTPHVDVPIIRTPQPPRPSPVKKSYLKPTTVATVASVGVATAAINEAAHQAKLRQQRADEEARRDREEEDRRKRRREEESSSSSSSSSSSFDWGGSSSGSDSGGGFGGGDSGGGGSSSDW